MSARGKQSESFVKLNVYQLLSIRIKMCQQKERANLMYTNSMNETIFFLRISPPGVIILVLNEHRLN